MTNSQKYALIRELAKLVVKYPPEVWQEVMKDLRDGTIVTALESFHASVPATKGEQRNLDPLIELRKTDPSLAATLLELRDKLRRRELMPGTNDLREFANFAGLKEAIPTKRDSAIAALVRWLSTLPAERVASIILKMKAHHVEHGDDFDRWARLIMDKPHHSD